ncbi:hypothetical protein IWQ60_000381 [Tieghemiomyces parasiticus]|uniref:MHD domain-containing protein n=1 Tax=Tieghemiomyces parasiticus TaxID=78921 RepID=A0A9W8DXN2_9FUNG|nr:hypothetical protein IWQ60_000381 [Tieghemiomyces parasiticus]
MIDSIYLIDDHGRTIIEKQWRSSHGTTVVNQFIKTLLETSTGDFRPIIELSSRFVGIHIKRDGIVFLCLVASEVSPFLVLEFLERFYQALLEYFGRVTEYTIKENFLTVTRVLEEMLDYGYPLTTDLAVLRDQVPVPNLVTKVMQTVTGSSTLGDRGAGAGGDSLVPWRKSGIRHKNNELYVDITEEVDAVLENTGQVTSLDITGRVTGTCLMSGMPDLTLTFANPSLLDDASFHPCVRLRQFEADRTLSFIPPDGPFKLLTYRVSQAQSYQPPLVMRAALTNDDAQYRVAISVGIGQTFARPLENVVIIVALSDAAANITTKAEHGTTSIDPRAKTVRWRHPKIEKTSSTLHLDVSFTTKASARPTVVLTAEFEIGSFAISGLKIRGLRLSGEHYQYYKGVKSKTISGKYQLRC